MIIPSLVSPLWFRYMDTVFVLIAFLATLVITLYSFKIYRLTDLRGPKYLSLAFLIIGLGLFFQGLLDFSLWYDVAHGWINEAMPLGMTPQLTYQGLFALAMAFTLFGYLTLTGLFLSSNIKSVLLMGVLFAVTIYSALFLRYAIFHGVLTAVIFVLTLHYYERSKKEKASLPFIAFTAILLGHVLFSLILVSPVFYVVSHLLRIAGFLILAYNVYSVTRK